MLEFRLLSTKCLSVEQQNRLIQTGVSYSCWDFIKSTPTNFKANPENKSLIFSSQNAVKSVFNQFRFSGNNCYCVGEKTQKLLEENGQKVVKMTQNASILADFILKNTKKEPFLFFTGNQRMPVIEAAFARENRSLEVVETYTSSAQPKAMGNYDAVLFYSPSGVESYLQNNSLVDSTSFAIGETTAQSLKKYTDNIITATQPTIEHLIAAVRKYTTTLA
jgi:uroporphyrinogen-III synthase